MNGSRCSGLLHCHHFLYAYPCLCCSYLHTDVSNFHPHEGILYVRIQHLVSQKWALSSDISKALNTSWMHQLPLLPWTSEKQQKEKKAENHKTPKKKQQQRGRARTREGTGQSRGPPKRFPRGKPETGQHTTKQHKATGGAVHLLACTVASMGDGHIDDFLFAMCVTLWGWDA